MRVYSRVVYEWRGDELVQVEAESYDYEGPVALAKGGSSAPENYENLERLYGIQADQAEFLGQTFKGTVAPAYKSWLGEAADYGSTANQEQAAQRAGKAASGAISQQQQALSADLASYGINPSDPRYAQGMREMGIQGAGQQAAAETTARDTIRDKGFARMQDAIGMGMGTPTQASQAANSAANAATGSLNAQNQAQQNQSNSIGNIVRAGTNIWGAYNDMNRGSGVTTGADGGAVTKRGIIRLKQGGYVQRLAAGGFAGGSTPGGGHGGGFMPTPNATPMPPPSRPPPPPSGAEQAGAAATSPLGMQGMRQGIGKAAEYGGKAFGSPGTEAFGKGMQMSPGQARAAQSAYQDATKQMAQSAVDKELGTGMPAPAAEADAVSQAGAAQSAADLEATQVGATTAADAETALASSQAAEAAAAAEAATTAGTAAATEGGLAATGAGLGAAAAVGTAVPVIGAGLALYGIGNAAGWWADGGAVQPGGGSPPPGSGSDRWKWSDPAWGINQMAHKNNWWADGGDVTPGSQQQTGEVDGPGGPKDDEVMAALSDGEFVMPVGAVKYYGIKHLENMRQKGLAHEKQLGIQ